MTWLVRTASAALVLVLAGPAAASHYFLEDAGLFSETEMEALREIGLRDTDLVLRGSMRPDQRAQLAFLTGIQEARVLELARICEFLQIDGIGPRVADLLLATGVRDVADLAQRDAEVLLAEIQVVNAEAQAVSVLPDLEHVSLWIEGARAARFRLTL